MTFWLRPEWGLPALLVAAVVAAAELRRRRRLARLAEVVAYDRRDGVSHDRHEPIAHDHHGPIAGHRVASRGPAGGPRAVRERWARWAGGLLPLLLLGVALGPRLGQRTLPAVGSELELHIGFDVSRSMAVGGPFDRFERGRRAVEALLAEAPGLTVALSIWGSSAHTVLPPTRDAAVVRSFLAALEPGLLSNPRSDAAAVGELVRALSEGDGHLLLVTDGEWAGEVGDVGPGERRIHGLFTGTPERGRVDPSDRTADRLSGESVADRGRLAALVASGRGEVLDAGDLDAVRRLAGRLRDEAARRRLPGTEEVPVDGTPLVAIATVIALLLGWSPRRPG